MISLFILIGAIWLYPVISIFLIWITAKHQQRRKKIINISSTISVSVIFSYLIGISTTCSELDMLLLSSVYFTLCMFLWLSITIRKTIYRVSAMILTGIFFAISYLVSPALLLGLGMALSSFTTHYEKWFPGGIIYKEIKLGGTLADAYGKRIEIYQTIPWLPIIEWRIQTKEYVNPTAYAETLNPIYHRTNRTLYLSASHKWLKSKTTHFKDSLLIP